MKLFDPALLHHRVPHMRTSCEEFSGGVQWLIEKAVGRERVQIDTSPARSCTLHSGPPQAASSLAPTRPQPAMPTSVFRTGRRTQGARGRHVPALDVPEHARSGPPRRSGRMGAALERPRRCRLSSHCWQLIGDTAWCEGRRCLSTTGFARVPCSRGLAGCASRVLRCCQADH